MNKASLRQQFIQKRKELTGLDVKEKSLLIAQKVIGFLMNKNFQNIHIFLPQQDKNEVNTWEIIPAIRKVFPAVIIVVPFVIPDSREMEHYILDADTVLINNRWGIPEPQPATAEKVLPYELDVVFLPLLTFDLLGYRVGYGGGYYDRFLAQNRPETLKIGLSFFEPVDKIDDIDEFDVKMNASITPDQILTW